VVKEALARLPSASPLFPAYSNSLWSDDLFSALSRAGAVPRDVGPGSASIVSPRQFEESSKYEHQADGTDAQTIPHWWPISAVRAQHILRMGGISHGKDLPSLIYHERAQRNVWLRAAARTRFLTKRDIVRCNRRTSWRVCSHAIPHEHALRRQALPSQSSSPLSPHFSRSSPRPPATSPPAALCASIRSSPCPMNRIQLLVDWLSTY
jgi:hypothetical protein